MFRTGEGKQAAHVMVVRTAVQRLLQLYGGVANAILTVQHVLHPFSQLVHVALVTWVHQHAGCKGFVPRGYGPDMDVVDQDV